jgi:hypothetical protein
MLLRTLPSLGNFSWRPWSATRHARVETTGSAAREMCAPISRHLAVWIVASSASVSSHGIVMVATFLMGVLRDAKSLRRVTASSLPFARVLFAPAAEVIFYFIFPGRPSNLFNSPADGCTKMSPLDVGAIGMTNFGCDFPMMPENSDAAAEIEAFPGIEYVRFPTSFPPPPGRLFIFVFVKESNLFFYNQSNPLAPLLVLLRERDVSLGKLRCPLWAAWYFVCSAK